LGLFTEVPPADGIIPNAVYQTWLRPWFGRSHFEHLRAFRERNRDYSFRFFDEAAMHAYMEDSYAGTEILQVFRNARFGPMRADIWRYCILYERGGVYCDINKAIRTPLRDLIPPGAGAVISFERNASELPCPPAARHVVQHCDKYVLQWALAFAPGHPLLRRVIDGIVEKYRRFRGRTFADPKDAILRLTATIHLTECVHAEAAERGLDDICQAGIDFNGQALIDLPGSYVRYAQSPAYFLQRHRRIVM